MARPRVLRDGTLIFPHRGNPPKPAEGYEVGSDPFMHVLSIKPCFHRRDRIEKTSCCEARQMYCGAKDKVVNRAECASCSRMPNLTQRVETFLFAIKNFATSERKFSAAEEVELRKGVCSECPYRNGTWCTACGCNLPAKQALASEACPIDAW